MDLDGSISHTPASNGLAEQYVGTVLTAVLAILLQSKLPMEYLDYPVRHVSWCKNMVPHINTDRDPYEVFMGHNSLDVHHVRPFGCKMLYHPVTTRLPTFKSPLHEVFCI